MLNLKTFSPDVLYAFAYQNNQPGTYVYHKHDFLELSTMLEGYSNYNVAGHWCRVNAGDVMLFNPGVYHQETQPVGTTSRQLHIGFRSIALPGVASDHLPFAHSLVHLGDEQAAYLACARQIAAESTQTEAFGHQVLLQAQVVTLLMYLMRALPMNTVSADQLDVSQTLEVTPSSAGERGALVSAATYYLEAHYAEELNLATLAATLHVSAAHLSRTFKAIRGETPSSYLTRIRMQRAQQLLTDSTQSVTQVAQAVGYQDPFYFSKLFKRHTGMTPSQVGK